MPEAFKRMVAHIEKQCNRTGHFSPEKCSDIAYGTATNYWKKRYGHAPRD